MTIMTTTREAEAYLEAVREELADLPEEERADLLEDLAQHLIDIAADDSRADVPLDEVLGAPADYASELRTAAGLPSKHNRWTDRVSKPDLRAWVGATRLGRAIKGPAGQRLIVPAWSFAKELAPGWWVVRGFLLVAIPAWWSPNRSDDFPIPTFAGSRALGVILIAAAVWASVRVGRSVRGRRRFLVAIADGAIVLAAFGLLLEASLRMGLSGPEVVYVERPSHAAATVHGPLTNIYPYDAQGRPLEGVLLYDQDGRPLRVARQEWWADRCERVPAHPRAADGVPVEHSYPLNYAVDLEAFGAQSQSELQQYRQMSEDRCLKEIPRPVVPIPTFPSGTAERATSAPAQGTP